MKIWHDDLGIAEDDYEMKVRPTGLLWKSEPGHWQVSADDAVIAADGYNQYAYLALSKWFRTIELLMLAGF